MPVLLPLIPSVPNYRVSTTLDARQYILDIRWNGRAGVWHMDLLDADETIIRAGMALVLGAGIGMRTADADFPSGIFIASDQSGEGVDATLDDMGERVQVFYFSAEEL